MRGAWALRKDASVLKQHVRAGTTRRVLEYARPFAWLLFVFLLLIILDAGIGIANPLIYRAIIDAGILGHDPSIIVNLALLVAGLAVIDVALSLGEQYISASIGNKLVLSMRIELFEHIQRMPLAFFTRTQTGALVSRLSNDVSGAQTAFTDILSNVVGNAITVILVLGAMFFLSWQITLAALVLLPLFILPARQIGRILQQITRDSYDLTAQMNNVMTERFNVAGAQLAKLFGHPKEESSAFARKAGEVSAIGVKRSIYGRILFMAFLLLASFATALTYGWGGVLAAKGLLDVGTVVALVSYLTRLYGPLTGLSNVQVDVMTALVSFDRVFEVLDLEPMIKEKPDAVTLARGSAKIEFDHVTFRYPSASDVSLASLESIALPEKPQHGATLGDISFTVEPGQLVALVGPSGAGKTTITQLIPRLYDPQSGSVSINGVDLRDATLASVRALIGVVAQDSHLFHDTIRMNLLYAKPDASEAEIRDALASAQLLPLIDSLANGLDTLVGDRGYRFSGGEKQRLAIARVLLKAPDIVILDEATAHLDSASEQAIQQAFETALSGRTSIVIAHRLSTILKADQILVVEKGHITERGTHHELLAKRGAYADLYHRQFAQEEKG
jgi:ATP-binding cassette subfamily B protein